MIVVLAYRDLLRRDECSLSSVPMVCHARLNRVPDTPIDPGGGCRTLHDTVLYRCLLTMCMHDEKRCLSFYLTDLV